MNHAAHGDALSLTQVKSFLMPPPRVSAFKPDQVWQQAREPMFWLDAALRVGWVNRAWEARTGQPAESVTGLPCASYGPTAAGAPADTAASLVPPPEVVAGRPAGTRALFLNAEGARLWRRIEFWPFRDPAGALLGILGQVREPSDPPSVPEFAGPRAPRQPHGAAGPNPSVVRTRVLDWYGPGAPAIARAGAAGGASTAPVLILGEPGTGKRLVARAIHQAGKQPERAVVTVDCEALPAEALERELFATSPPSGPTDESQPADAASSRPRLAGRR